MEREGVEMTSHKQYFQIAGLLFNKSKIQMKDLRACFFITRPASFCVKFPIKSEQTVWLERKFIDHFFSPSY